MVKTRSLPRALAPLLWALPALAVLGLGALDYLPFLSDDALISLRYADRLLDGHGLTWTDGERVEGYSNLLWILLCALAGGVGTDLIVAARALGLLGAAAALAAVVFARRPRGAADALPALGGSLALAASGPLAVWSIGGLEQPLQAGLLGWALVAAYPLVDDAAAEGRGWVPGLLLALLCWTRPDAPLFTVGVIVGLLLSRGWNPATRALCLRVAGLPVLAYAAQLAFRVAYYDAWWPNSALAKVAFTSNRLADGLAYVGSGLAWLGALVLPAIGLGVVAWRQPQYRRRLLLLASPLGLWLVYVAVIGGDSFPARRYFVPVAVLLALIATEGLDAWLRVARSRRLAFVLTASALTVLLVTQHVDPQNRRARLERWEWDGEVIGLLLARAFPERPLIAVDPAGTLPYFSKLPALDMLGINDRHLARHRPEDFGRGALGHELGDGAYVLDRQPDLVVFCGPAGGASPCFRSGKEMVRDPRFARHYRLATFEGHEPRTVRARIWVRAEDGRIGIRRDGAVVRVPGYLLTDTAQAAASLDAAGRLAVPVAPGGPAGIAGLAVDGGAWRLRVLAEGDPVVTAVRRSGSAAELASGGADVEFRLQRAAAIDVLVGAGGGEARVLGLELTRP